jgi:hypothetical protein
MQCCSAGRYLAGSRYRPNSGQIIFGTKIAKNMPDYDHFSNKNNMAGIWPIPATCQIPASATALHTMKEWIE